jgi:hypothetical protein
MKLSGFLQKVGKVLEAAVAQQPVKAQQVKRPQAAQDGFEVARRAPVDLGRTPGASAAADGDFVKGLYRDLLGREPDADGFKAHMNGLSSGMSRDAIKTVFLTSPEFREKQEAAANPAPAPVDAPAAAPLGVGPVALEGYDATKLHNLGHQTVKYQFGRVASHHSLENVKSHADAEALLNKMRPDFEAAGLKVLDVKGDKIRVETELGEEWVDVVRGAGSGNPGWWWGSEGKAIPGTTPGTTTPTAPTAPTAPGNPATEPGAALSTVPQRPEYAAAPIDRSSGEAAARSAAQWVKDSYPQLFGRGDDRQVAFEVMTHVIGAMRAAGFDAHRVVNHPSRPIGDGQRYGSDAVVVGGHIYDVYGAFGDPGRSDVQTLNQGPYEAGRLRE